MRKALLLALAVVLAGCSGGGSDDSPADPTSSSSMTSTGPPPKPVVYSDTLHLLAPPVMALVLPDGSAETSTPTDQGFGPGGGGQDGPEAEWSHQMKANSNVTSAEVHIWIEITDNLVQPVDPRDPQESCTWMIVLSLGSDGEREVSCLAEPAGAISPGTKELIFEVLALDTELEYNETVTLSFQRNAFSASMDNSVFVLSGSTTHDSRILLKGLKEPVSDA